MGAVVDVAAYILRRCGSMTTMKLQKLVFYSQAESLARYGCPLFEEDFQAWRNGPVCYELYLRHRGKFLVRDGELSVQNIGASLDERERAVIDRVCDALASKTGNELSERTHVESPWRDARGNLAPSAPCGTVISKERMRSFYVANPVVRG